MAWWCIIVSFLKYNSFLLLGWPCLVLYNRQWVIVCVLRWWIADTLVADWKASPIMSIILSSTLSLFRCALISVCFSQQACNGPQSMRFIAQRFQTWTSLGNHFAVGILMINSTKQERQQLNEWIPSCSRVLEEAWKIKPKNRSAWKPDVFM